MAKSYILIFLLGLLNLTSALGQSPRSLLLLHTSDTHSCVEPISLNFSDTAQAGKAGYVRRASMLEELRRKHHDMLVLDCGDFSQGSVYYNLFQGEVEVLLMNRMRYDACCIGNHEFDSGLENLAHLIRMADFPVVCCNYDFRRTPCQGLVKPYCIIERAGVRVGILGVSPKLSGLVAKKCYGKTRYLDPVKCAQPIVDRLRNQEHCDVVVCLSHLGWLGAKDGDEAFIQATEGIDVVLGGHSHTYFDAARTVKNRAGRDVLVSHMGKNGRYVGLMELEVE